MILGIINLILFVVGIFMAFSKSTYDNVLCSIFGITFSVISFFGIICFIFINLETIMNLFKI